MAWIQTIDGEVWGAMPGESEGPPLCGHSEGIIIEEEFLRCSRCKKALTIAEVERFLSLEKGLI